MVANSLGCQVVAALAAEQPWRLAGVMLTGPTVDPAARGFGPQLFRLLRDTTREPLAMFRVMTADFLRAGSEFTSTTLSRFYGIHMLLIPGLIAALIGAHLFLVAKLGTTAPPWLKAEKARDLAQEEI